MHIFIDDRISRMVGFDAKIMRNISRSANEIENPMKATKRK